MAAPKKPARKRMPRRAFSRALAHLGLDEQPVNPYTLPTILPGVMPAELPSGDKLVLAMDSSGREFERKALDNMPPSAWSQFAQATGFGPGLAFLGFPYLAQLNQITEYRTPSEALSQEMTRSWGKLVNKGEDDLTDKLHDITECMEQMQVRDKFRECSLKTEEFGRSHLAPRIKNQNDDVIRQQPLTKIDKGDLLGFASIEPYWLTPYSWNSTDPMRDDFYRPQSWFVLGKKTHASRLMTFIFREVPDLLKPAYDFAGISMTQLMMPYVNRWLRTAKNVNDLINIFSIVTLSTDLQSLLQDPVEFAKRLQTFTQCRDNRGLMTINKDTETLETNDVSLGSLDKLQAQSQEHMATPSRMPLIKFFGITPSGLNATSEGEFQNWYDYVRGLQELGFGKHIERVIQLVQLHLYGSVDPNIVWEWSPLKELSGKELSDLRKTDADRDVAYINAGVVDNQEVRNRLQNDPDSGYDNLVGDAPDPPQVVEQQLGEETAENAHARGEESAEAAHGRTKDLQKTAPKPGSK